MTASKLFFNQKLSIKCYQKIKKPPDLSKKVEAKTHEIKRTAIIPSDNKREILNENSHHGNSFVDNKKNIKNEKILKNNGELEVSRTLNACKHGCLGNKKLFISHDHFFAHNSIKSSKNIISTEKISQMKKSLTFDNGSKLIAPDVFSLQQTHLLPPRENFFLEKTLLNPSILNNSKENNGGSVNKLNFVFKNSSIGWALEMVQSGQFAYASTNIASKSSINNDVNSVLQKSITSIENPKENLYNKLFIKLNGNLLVKNYFSENSKSSTDNLLKIARRTSCGDVFTTNCVARELRHKVALLNAESFSSGYVNKKSIEKNDSISNKRTMAEKVNHNTTRTLHNNENDLETQHRVQGGIITDTQSPRQKKTVTNTKIKSSKETKGKGRRRDTVEGSKIQETNRATLMLVCVVCVFLVVEIPPALLFLLILFEVKLELNLLPYYYYTVLTCVFNFGVIFSYQFNFFIYCCMSQQFRTTFKDIVCRPFMRSRCWKKINVRSFEKCVSNRKINLFNLSNILNKTFLKDKTSADLKSPFKKKF